MDQPLLQILALGDSDGASRKTETVRWTIRRLFHQSEVISTILLGSRADILKISPC